MQHIALIPWLDPETIIAAAGPWALLVVCFIVFAETGLLIGFLLPGDTLLIISGLLSHPSEAAPNGVFGVSVWWVALLIGLSAFIGGEVGYFIGYKGGPAVFERKESGLFSVKNVERTNAFFVKYGGLTIIVARFVPIVRTFAPVAAGVGKMHKGRYTLYNFVGAVLWGFGLTMFGYAIGFIPVVGELVAEYIDLILLVAVGGTLLVTLWHYFRERSKARREEAAGEDVVTDAEEARQLVLDPEVFDRGPEHQHPDQHRGERRHDPLRDHRQEPRHGDGSPPPSQG
ncbi:DedA family protein [Microbacterium sp. BK668]|uniref:DedA family protein n=1 Tax=Microbacterium sp. BK668 TaxID=2512118 RepID=UPI001060C476|nr:DedA family protein [Microbacterium sp. BK668]TDN92548.1 membrane-associated protein [Microbacterium sp. BK668]